MWLYNCPEIVLTNIRGLSSEPESLRRTTLYCMVLYVRTVSEMVLSLHIAVENHVCRCRTTIPIS